MQNVPHFTYVIDKFIVQTSCLLHLVGYLFKIHGFRNPSQKFHGFRGTHGTHANAATATAGPGHSEVQKYLPKRKLYD